MTIGRHNGRSVLPVSPRARKRADEEKLATKLILSALQKRAVMQTGFAIATGCQDNIERSDQRAPRAWTDLLLGTKKVDQGMRKHKRLL